MKHIRKLFPYIRPYWNLALLALGLLTVQVFLDLAIPRLIQRIIDQGIRANDLGVVIQTSLVMLGISLTATALALGNNSSSIRVGESVARDLREAVFLKIQGFSYSNLDQFSTGKLMVRLSSDAGAVARLAQVTLRIGTRAPLMMIGSLILMFNTDRSLALSLLPVLLVTAIIIVFFSTRMEPLFRTVQQKLDILNTVLQENIAGARLVKAFVRAGHESGRFEEANEDFTARTILVMRFMSTMWPVLAMLINLGMVGVIWLGGKQAIEGNLTLGQIVAFTNYLLTTMGPLTMMAMLSNMYANGIASAQRVNEVLDTVSEIEVSPQARPLPDQVQGRVEFRDVSFHYDGGEDNAVLEGINLTAEPGQTVAILGATGAGKTTLVNLIPRYYDATAGQVLVDGVDVRDLQPESLLSQVGIVPQETILFSGTVRENICYGRPQASEAEMIAAAQAAQAHDFIMELPLGYDTRVEERGVNLSGGQKQRIAIARALITLPKILILDDSTSSVDVETETRIQAALEQIMHKRTCFMVAQRISTVLNADKIVVIEMGRIAAEGTHANLLQTSPIYREIYDSQLGNGFAEPIMPEQERAYASQGVERR